MFYLKLAFSNIKKNKQTYLPYILTCICSIMMIYILRSISENAGLDTMFGGGQMKFTLDLGNVVMSFFCVFFLFYTNSFLIKRRKKELGLYNILGMEKKHLALVLFYETLITALVSMTLGILAGILFSRFMFALLLYLLHFPISLSFEISGSAILSTCALFAIIFTLTLLNNLRQIQLSKPIELIHGDKTGEKEPKGNLLMALVGILCLSGAYTLSLSIKSPLEAMLWFFVAVLLVIVGTHALFTSISIVCLKLLRKNKKFYYQTRHFTAISGMIYRMKQNAAGLANICILSTCVLVMLSTTVSLYAGMEESLRIRYPHNITLSSLNVTDEESEQLNQIISEVMQSFDDRFGNEEVYRYYTLSVMKKENGFSADNNSGSMDAGIVMILPLEEYNRLAQRNVTLNDNEVLFLDTTKVTSGNTLQLMNSTYHIQEKLTDFPIDINKEMGDLFDSYALVVKDKAAAMALFEEATGKRREPSYYYGVDLIGEESRQTLITDKLSERLNEYGLAAYVQSAVTARQSFYSLYGGLLFIGIFLGAIFILATVLIIYYKQVSEGYDDAGRFEIMQKVGMTKKEVKRSIQSQILMVFFLPLLVAIVHVAFAYPIITKLLIIFNLGNDSLFFLSTLLIIGVFALFYLAVYTMTAKVYYQIVQ